MWQKTYPKNVEISSEPCVPARYSGPTQRPAEGIRTPSCSRKADKTTCYTSNLPGKDSLRRSNSRLDRLTCCNVASSFLCVSVKLGNPPGWCLGKLSKENPECLSDKTSKHLNLWLQNVPNQNGCWKSTKISPRKIVPLASKFGIRPELNEL